MNDLVAGDLEGIDIIRVNHVAESLQYRPRSLMTITTVILKRRCLT